MPLLILPVSLQPYFLIMVNNDFVIFQIDCHLAKKETTDDREFDLAIDPDGTFADFETGFVLAGSTCTQLSGLTGKWKTRDLDGCTGQNAFNDDRYKTHVVCKKTGPCGGQWEPVFRHFAKKSSDIFTSNPNAMDLNYFDAGLDMFSRLFQLDSNYRKDDGTFHFKIVYPELDMYNEWTQTSDFTQNSGVPATDVTPITIMSSSLPTFTSFNGKFCALASRIQLKTDVDIS